MINFTKRLLSKLNVPRGLVVIRFPWSLVSIPMILLGWYHFSDQPMEKGRSNRVKTSSLAGGSPHPFTEGSQTRGTGTSPGTIVTASAIENGNVIESDADAEDPLDAISPSGARDSDARCRAKIVGEWEDDYQGKRHLTVNEDGSGTMVVELDGIGKRLFAARLAFDLDWSVADGRVVMKTLGGEPKSKVQLVLKLYGSEADYKILELTDERMLLMDADGKTKYDWRRPGATAAD
jgi:hypothetical protein